MLEECVVANTARSGAGPRRAPRKDTPCLGIGTHTASTPAEENRRLRTPAEEPSRQVPLKPEVKEKTRKIRQLSVGKLLESTIRGIQHGTSVSALFTADLGADLLA